ncbi:substrate-binding protein [Pusillimonas sp. ANT_WB101]|uniref:substrate-binding protein n=1 Tax=Pusillimonas sp. ANT_WB101 TaxID=2597356 RepID=UPI0021059356|nr:substrate-binding protein [Pusillimonas sp. ANT_WB101]
MGKKHIKNEQGATQRRDFLKTGSLVAGGLLLPVASGGAAFAQGKEYPKLGNYPDGVSGDKVVAGLTLDLTGPYSAEGAGQKRGFELAAEMINNGDERVKKVSPLTKQGILGKKLVLAIGDAETKPNSAVQAATRFIRQDKAMMIAGSVSSSVAIALQNTCERAKTLYFPIISGSSDTTGKDCRRYGFRLCHHAYTAAKAIAPVLSKEYGKEMKVIYLVPDYNYGHSIHDHMREFTEAQGWTTIDSAQIHPLGATDYSAYMLNIANSGADILINLDYGADAVNSAKQAHQFGVLKNMKMCVPYMPAYMLEEVGPEIMQGVLGTMDFWWSESQKNEVGKDFVEAYEAKFNAKPRDPEHNAYMTMLLWADAIERAGTFYPAAVVEALEDGVNNKRPHTMGGEVYFRAEDHDGAADFVVVRGKKPDEIKNPDDLVDVVAVANGVDTLPPVGYAGCKMSSAA